MAIVENPNGSGAYLRSDITVLDETTVVTELAQGTTVALTDGPIITDDGVWFWVATADGLEGFVSDAMLTAAPVDDAVPDVTEPVAEETSTESETVTEKTPVSPDLLWQEPIDAGFVVDNNSEIPAEGLACRATATVDGEILSRVPVNATLQVVAPRIWIGEQSFVHINCADGAGYVNGAYVVLQSEQVAEEPVAEEVVTEDVATEPVVEEVVTEPVDEDVVTEPVTEEVVTEPVAEEIVTDPITEEVATEPVAEEMVTEPVVEEVLTETVTETVTEEVVAEPVVEETVTEEVISELTTEEIVTEPVTEEVATEPIVEDVVTEDAGTATDVDTATEVSTETTTEPVADEVTTEVAPETETTTETVAAPAEVTTETETTTEAAEVTTETATDTAPAEEAATTETETETDTATDEAVVDVETGTTTETAPTAEKKVADADTTSEKKVEETAKTTDTTTEKVAVQSEPVVPAVTAPASDISKMIGSATVTGTNGEGLKCRAAPDASSATLMVLEEGTKVYVLQEPVNGYLGIDCGGLQGFADVNHLWSGGAGDEEITKSSMTLVVTGTGNGLNCRTGASTSYPVITVLYDGTTVKTRGAASNGWVPVTCAGQAGHVATPYVEVASGGSSSGSTSTTTGKATVVNTNNEGLYCRSGASTSYSAITILSPGQTVSVRGANQGEWTPVICANTNGFAHSAFLSITAGSTSGGGSTSGPTAPTTSTGKVTVTGTNNEGLNCRSGAGTSHSVITVLRPAQTVDTRSGSVSGWQAVICGGKNGFVSSQYVTASGGSSTPSAPAPTPTPTSPSSPSGMVSGDRAKTTANLNLRYDASLGSSVAAVAPTGTVVKITGGLSNGFYAVDWDGLRGYMSSDYLTKTSEALSERGGSGTPTTTTPPSSGSGSGSATGNAVVDYAMRYLGYPYVWATHGPASFDCSGFTYWVVKNVIGKDIGYGTWTQVAAGTRVSRANLQPGDLVFFQNTYTAGLSHVGIYIGNNKFIHAQNEETGVVISDLDSSYYGPRWYGAVRL